MKFSILFISILSVVLMTGCVKSSTRADAGVDGGAGGCTIGGHANSGSHPDRASCEEGGGTWH
jgi:hypothetical protein